MQELFNSSSGEKKSINEVVAEIIKFIKQDEKRTYRITIGTDSEILSNLNADFVTAIVVHRIGNGGRYFWRRIEQGKFYNLRDRIIQEVILSLDLGKKILNEFKKMFKKEWKEKGPNWEFEIHIDIGEKGETKAMIQEVVGMVRAYNFEPITKPKSYAASNIADRHV
ncbi:MAG: ribonuclease H-like YkuK family protein [Minisyncoccia bacterium]